MKFMNRNEFIRNNARRFLNKCWDVGLAEHNYLLEEAIENDMLYDKDTKDKLLEAYAKLELINYLLDLVENDYD